MRVLLASHVGFCNRGNEAIVRSTIALLRERWEDASFLIHSWDCDRDQEVCDIVGVDFTPWLETPSPRRYSLSWAYGQVKRRLFRIGEPLIRLSRREMKSLSCALSVGGDMFTLCYGVPSHHMTLNRQLMRHGVPTILWGASIGPFQDDRFLPRIRDHLARLQLITVRESLTQEYLRGIGIHENVVRVADSAFAMDPQPFDTDSVTPPGREGVVGISCSHLMERFCKDEGTTSLVDMVTCLVDACLRKGYGVVLVPHVTAPRRAPNKLSYQDDDFLRQVMQNVDPGRRGGVRLAPTSLNSPQMKYLIGKSRFFFGTRMHACVAAVSSGIPTCFLSYSTKSRGLSRDVYGQTLSEKLTLPIDRLNATDLVRAIEVLEDNEDVLRKSLLQKANEMKSLARDGVRALAKVI